MKEEAVEDKEDTDKESLMWNRLDDWELLESLQDTYKSIAK